MARGTALVTGASGGIGLEIARVLAERGYDVVLTARGAERLAAAADALRARGVRAEPVALDLVRPDGSRRLIEAVQERGLAIDVLVNNAGFATFGAFAETDLERELEEIGLNVAALTALTKRVLPGMLARGAGRILNVASIAAFVPGPTMAVYYATKAYVLSFSQALAVELRGRGVTVTCLCPGATQSEFFERARMTSSGLVAGRTLPSAASVAAFGVAAMERGTEIAIPGWDNRALPVLSRVLPRGVLARIVQRVQAPRP